MAGIAHYRCGQCDLLWLDPERFVQPEDWYTDEYYDGRDFEKTGGERGYPVGYSAQTNAFKNSSHRAYVNLIAKKPYRKVLDFGCGYGHLGKLIADSMNDCVVDGIEVNESVRNKAEANLNGRACASLDETPGSYDCVFMVDVIEHLIDPLDIVQKLRDQLTKDGELVISTPNIASFNARRYGAEWILHAPPTHTHYFSRKSLYGLLARAGFRLEKCFTLGTPFHNCRAGMEGKRDRLAKAVLGNPLMDRLLCRRLLLGSIIVVSAKRV
jgi:2-polyprenyl-3-methyl-5-hydroxy-6-metoxy-1,4-benzoquinol methylase